jgi:hypothetical protein
MSVTSHPAAMMNPETSNGHGTSRGDCSIQINIFLCTLDQERFPQSGIVTATGRHPPPPRVAGPAEAQLALRQLRLIFAQPEKANTALI